VATLAQLSLQQSKIDQAVKMFERQSELARSEPELVNALTYQYVSGALFLLACFKRGDADGDSVL
jgi:import receptor subunit TOM70